MNPNDSFTQERFVRNKHSHTVWLYGIGSTSSRLRCWCCPLVGKWPIQSLSYKVVIYLGKHVVCFRPICLANPRILAFWTCSSGAGVGHFLLFKSANKLVPPPIHFLQKQCPVSLFNIKIGTMFQNNFQFPKNTLNKITWFNMKKNLVPMVTKTTSRTVACSVWWTSWICLQTELISSRRRRDEIQATNKWLCLYGHGYVLLCCIRIYPYICVN